jgi:hypothetical protein
LTLVPDGQEAEWAAVGVWTRIYLARSGNRTLIIQSDDTSLNGKAVLAHLAFSFVVHMIVFVDMNNNALIVI